MTALDLWAFLRAKALASWAARYPWQALCIILAAFSAYCWHGWGIAADEVARMKAARKPAATAQVAVNHEPARKSAVIAEHSNAEAPAYYRAVHAAADAHRVRAATCRPVNPDLSGAVSVAPVNDGPAANAEMVARPKADDDLIVAAAGRAAQMHSDALDLIAAGVAVAGE